MYEYKLAIDDEDYFPTPEDEPEDEWWEEEEDTYDFPENWEMDE